MLTNIKFTYYNYKQIINDCDLFKYNLLFLKKSIGCQGKHVFPVKTKEDVEKIMESKYKNNNEIFILEKGIDNLLLYNQKKFDMRIYLLFTRENLPINHIFIKNGLSELLPINMMPMIYPAKIC